jgi:uncharacterized protein (TIGR02145 family)
MKKVLWINPIILAAIILFIATGCKKEEFATKPAISAKSATDSTKGQLPDTTLGQLPDTTLGQLPDSIQGVIGGVIEDADGNVYHTITIGTQTWFVENLRTTKYLNGDPIPSPLSAEQWDNDSVGAFKSGSEIYGNLYNTYAVEDSRRLCPAGWHIPSIGEWSILLNYLGGEGLAGGPLKETGTAHWLNPNEGATNQSGFTALPAGWYNPKTGDRSIHNIGTHTAWWSSSKDLPPRFWAVQCDYLSTGAGRTQWDRSEGLSIRCMKGDPDPSTLVTHPSTDVIGQGNNMYECPAEAKTEPMTNLTSNGVTLNGIAYANGLPTTVTFEYALQKSIIPIDQVEWATGPFMKAFQ